MEKKAGKTALVIGGSMAGLLAACILSEHFEKVVILECDLMHNEPNPGRGLCLFDTHPILHSPVTDWRVEVRKTPYGGSNPPLAAPLFFNQLFPTYSALPIYLYNPQEQADTAPCLIIYCASLGAESQRLPVKDCSSTKVSRFALVQRLIELAPLYSFNPFI
jgi:hypothetical protein